MDTSLNKEYWKPRFVYYVLYIQEWICIHYGCKMLLAYNEFIMYVRTYVTQTARKSGVFPHKNRHFVATDLCCHKYINPIGCVYTY